MAAGGLLTYVHPPSALAWGFAIWLGYVLYLPTSWNIAKKTAFLIVLGIVYVGAASALIYPVLLNKEITVGRALSLLMSAFTAAGGGQVSDPQVSWRGFVYDIGGYWFVPAGLLGALVLIVVLDGETRREVLLLVSWLLSLTFVAVGMPLLEARLSARFSFPRPPINLADNLQYTIPLMQIACLGFLFAVFRTLPAILRIFPIALATFVVYHYANRSQTIDHASATIIAWREGQLVPSPPPGWEEKTHMLNKIRDTVPPLKKVVVDEMELNPSAVRYYALRPLAFTTNDGGAFFLRDSEAISTWSRRNEDYEHIEKIADPGDKLQSMSAFATAAGADFLVAKIPPGVNAPSSTTMSYHDPKSSLGLIKLHP